jgi:hypothetical protein
VIPALRRELELEGLSLHTFSAGAVPEVEEDYTEYEEDVFIDDVHGEELSGGEVASARAEEVDWVKKRGVVKIARDGLRERRTRRDLGYALGRHAEEAGLGAVACGVHRD